MDQTIDQIKECREQKQTTKGLRDLWKMSETINSIGTHAGELTPHESGSRVSRRIPSLECSLGETNSQRAEQPNTFALCKSSPFTLARQV